MRRLEALIVVVLALVLPACQSIGLVHHAKVLDVPLDVRVTDFGVEPLKMQPRQPRQSRHPFTLLDITVSIENPSDEHLWANGCRGLAFDGSGTIVYTFSVGFAPPAGLELEGHHTWQGPASAVARVPHELAARGIRATVTCQAWDWGGYAPI